MQILLRYGRTGLTVALPDDVAVLTARPAPGVGDETAVIRQGLRAPIGCAPLAEKMRPGDAVVIAHSDITRATPNARLLPPLLAELEAAGVRRDDITLLNALGTHRRQTGAELRALLGDDIVDAYRCLQHDGNDDAGLVALGVTSFGHPVRVNRRFVEADARILTGLIEPHFFAGFSGGPKGVLPALAGAESVLTNHGVTMINHPNATWGRTRGNPVWEEMLEVAQMARPTFLLNVTINAAGAITGVFAGDLEAAHAQGCEFVRAHAMAAVSAPYDVVVVTNGGYPLDQNLYQTVKGMSAARQIVRSGGAILMAAACEDGIPAHGRYAALLAEGGSPQGVLEMVARPGFAAADQWQVQIQALIQRHADVYVYSDGLTDAQIAAALLTPCRDIPATVQKLRAQYGPRVAVLPEGPYIVPYIP
ncbi:MAG TPA: nickel-dependent lactate racemase [Anaerolineae bacterium]|nr:nickel-dependent lactate racemase [Anaerolineae bacterium]